MQDFNKWCVSSIITLSSAKVLVGLNTHAEPELNAVAGRLRTNNAQLYDRTRFLLTRYDDCASDSDSDGDGDVSEDDLEQRGLRRLAENVKVHTDCLTDLNTALEDPAIDPDHDDEASVPRVKQRTAHDYHADLVLAKFPNAHTSLVERLGRTSWDRYCRMQQEREQNAIVNANALADEQQRIPSAAKSDFADSEFQDSGLGTSIPSAPSQYAETVISFMTSLGSGKRVQIPLLPAEAKLGQQFDCSACGRIIHVTNNRVWR
jgi:hypothetical protein